MSNDQWSKEWPSPGAKIMMDALNQMPPSPEAQLHQIQLTTFENGSFVHKLIDPSEYINLEPTHDPYTNPNAHLYHECACGAILDPCTKSFAALNNAASEAGWKIRWGEQHYKAYCPKCGEKVE